MQLPRDAAQDLAVVTPGLATLAIAGQQRSHTEEGLIGELEHLAASRLVNLRSATLSAATAINSQVRL
jgi:hypothetical protein